VADLLVSDGLYDDEYDDVDPLAYPFEAEVGVVVDVGNA
jgi:hypothetical protein